MKKKLLIISLLLLSLTGCSTDKKDSSTTDGSTTENINVSTEAIVTSESSLEDFDSIAESDWAIKDYSFANTPNLYEISLPLHHDYGRITDMEVIGEYFYIVYGDWQDNFSLYKVNPITSEIEKDVVLEDGLYSEHCLVLSEDNLKILNSDTNTIHSFDQELNIVDTQVLSQESSLSTFLTEEYAYYYDPARKGIFKYTLASDVESQLLPGVSLDYSDFSINGVLGEDEFILYSYKDSDRNTFYEVRNIQTGECLYSQTEALTYKNSIGDTYAVDYTHKMVTYELYGNINEEEPYTLYINHFDSNSYSTVDINESYLLTCKRVGSKEDSQITLCIDLCDKASKETYKSLQINLEGDVAREYTLDNAILLDDKYIIFSICDLQTEILIWDITESTTVDVADTRLFKWNNFYAVDEDFSRMLDEKASVIEEKHHITIHYGDAVTNYIPYGFSITPVTNGFLTMMALETLDTSLEIFPEGMLTQLDSEYSTEINYIFVEELSGSEMAFYGGLQYYYNGKTYAALRVNETCAATKINGTSTLTDTIHHETFHAMEMYMTNKSSGACFSEWNQYNPDDFNYYNSYSYFDSATYETETYKYTPGDPYGVEVYFTQPYAKVNAVEDRAELFGVLTNPSNPDYGYVTNINIQPKVKYISQELRKYFDTTGWPEVTLWETTLQ